MLFIYEMKKILKRISPLIIVVFILAVAAVTIITSASAFNTPPTPVDHTPAYTALQAKIAQWDEPRQEEISTAFSTFYDKYKDLNAATYNHPDLLVTKYNETRTAFQDFYAVYYKRFINDGNTDQTTNYLLVRREYIRDLNAIMVKLDTFLTGEKDADAILKGLAINAEWKGVTTQAILNNIFVQRIAPADLAALKEFCQTHTPSNDAYDYVYNQYLLAVAKSSQYTGSLSDYDGFTDYVDAATSTRAITLAAYRLAHPENAFTHAFAFGQIYNNTPQVSIMDFIFTNLEMATIPLLILVIILATCAFFTDTYQRTIITTLAATRKRTSVIIVKTLAVFTLTLMALLLFTGIYAVSGVLFFNGTLAPDILFLLNGTTAVVMSQLNYFVLYFLSLLFKILPFIAICGLFAFAKANPWVIVGGTIAVSSVVILCNGLLGGFWFYQFIPLLALDPIRYLGAELFFAPTPPTFNIWYTLPVMLVIIVYLYWQLIHNFKRKDF